MNYKTLSLMLAIVLIGTLAYFLLLPRPSIIEKDGNKILMDQTNQSLVLEKDGEAVNFSFEELIGLFDMVDYNKVMDVDPSLIAEWEASNKVIDSVDTGSPLDLNTAATRWRAFSQWNTRRYNLIREIKPNGFAFGKHRIRKMLNRIDAVNEGIMQRGDCGTPNSIGAVCDSLIYGVRLNLTFNKEAGNKDHIDALFTPIKKDGKSYHPIRTYTRDNTAKAQGDLDDMLLNASIPCPNNCN